MTTQQKPKTTHQHGGKRPGSGRKSGTPNKTTATLKQIAGAYSEEALKTLVEVMRDPASPPTAKIAAADKLLDRAHGKPTIAVDATLKVPSLDMEQIARNFTEVMAKSRERQRQVLIERGLMDENGNKIPG